MPVLDFYIWAILPFCSEWSKPPYLLKEHVYVTVVLFVIYSVGKISPVKLSVSQDLFWGKVFSINSYFYYKTCCLDFYVPLFLFW